MTKYVDIPEEVKSVMQEVVRDELESLKVPGGFTDQERQAIADNDAIDELPCNQPSTALVPVDTQLSIPENATVQERLTMMSFLGDAVPLWDQQGRTLSIVGIMAYDSYKRDILGAPVVDEEGEPVPCKATIWRDEEGILYRAQSMVVYGFCRDKVWPIMTTDNKPGLLLAPLKVRIGQKRTRNGQMTFRFDIVG